MNRKLLSLSGFLPGIIFLWILLGASLGTANPLCDLAEKWTLLNERLEQEGLVLGQKLGAKLTGDPTIAAHARFQNHPQLNPKIVAQEQIDEALGAAENVASGLLGDKAAGAWVDTATLKRVVDTDGISYQEQGTALGKLAQQCQKGELDPDETVKTILESRKANFDTLDRPWNDKYNEAHYLRDLNTIFDSAPEEMDLKGFLSEQTAQTAGRPFEVRLAAARKDEGLVGLVVDSKYYGGDLETGEAVYNAGLTEYTISGKLTQSAERVKIKNAIFAAADAPGGGKEYRFAVSEKIAVDPDQPEPEALILLKERFKALDDLIRAERPGFRSYEVGNIVLESFK